MIMQAWVKLSYEVDWEYVPDSEDTDSEYDRKLDYLYDILESRLRGVGITLERLDDLDWEGN